MCIIGEIVFVLHLWGTPHTDRLLGHAPPPRKQDDTLFTADGSPLNAHDVQYLPMELRDDRERVRTALETVRQFGQLLKDGGTTKEVVYVDEREGYEYIKLEEELPLTLA